MRDLFHKGHVPVLLLLFLIGYVPSLRGVEGTGVCLKVSLSGKIYRQFSFLVEEDLRPAKDLGTINWFMTTAEVNYRPRRYFMAGGGYLSIARHKNANELRHQFFFFATGFYTVGNFYLTIRKRYQRTRKIHSTTPKHSLRAMLSLTYRPRSTGFAPYFQTEVFNDPKNGMHADKIRFNFGSNYRLNPRDNFQLYYRYYAFHMNDSINFRHSIGITYMHRF